MLEGLEAAGLEALEELVAGDPRDTELSAQRGHVLALEPSGHESEGLMHRFALSPGHLGRSPMPNGVNHVSGIKCQRSLAKHTGVRCPQCFMAALATLDANRGSTRSRRSRRSERAAHGVSERPPRGASRRRRRVIRPGAPYRGLSSIRIQGRAPQSPWSRVLASRGVSVPARRRTPAKCAAERWPRSPQSQTNPSALR